MSLKFFTKISYLEELLSIEKTNSIAYLNLGRCFFYLKELEKAVLCFKNVIKYEPSNFIAHVALADIFRLNNKFKEAEMLYIKSLQIKPYNPGALHGLAVLLEAANKNQEAKKLLGELVNRHPSYPLSQIILKKVKEEKEKVG